MRASREARFAAGDLGDYDIFLYDLGANKLTQLTSDTAWNDYPRFSPDATQIAYGSTRSGKQEIWLMNADGSGARSLTANLKWADFPTWSPDGKEIAFVSNEYFHVDLFSLELETGKLQRLTDDDNLDCYPDWSPDGRQIAFSSQRGAHQDIYTLDLSTLQQKRITSHPGPDTSPSFSPDGKKVAFVSQRPDQKGGFEPLHALSDFFYGSNHLDIWTADLATGNVMQVTTNRGVDRNVRWSPDGKYVAYTSSTVDHADAHIMLHEIATGKITPLKFDENMVRREVERPLIADLNKPVPQIPLEEGKLDQILYNVGKKMMPSIDRMTPGAVNEHMGKYRQRVMDRMYSITARYLDWK